jgi:mRNA-degrading endonuclease RelE of RelBE toxin-antitoxin system
MAFKVLIKKSALKNLVVLPRSVQLKFETLVRVLTDSGATGPHNWQNYSKLEVNKYHCHLTYHVVACWRHEKHTITIEVYYVGSREAAPY